jgi:CheY-like chemotaxis protein
MSEKRLILIADDDPDIVTLIRDLLEFEGFQTVSAYEGVRAIEIVHKRKPDLILLDLQMPAGTGQSVLENIRTVPDTKKIPVIVLTGLQASDLEEECLALGAQAFIRKPYERELLLAKIRQLIG